MTYQRKYKKKACARKTYAKPMKYQVADMAETALKGVNQIRKLINVEIKYFDTAFNASSCTTSGTITSIAAVPQGDTDNSRDGNSIKPQSLVWRGRMNNNTADNSEQTVRFIIFRVVHDNGVVPAVTDLLESASVDSLFNATERNRFHVLMDKTVSTKASFSTQTNNSQLRFGKAMKGHIKYEDGATTYEAGGLYLLQISYSATNAPTHTSNFRIKYTDN